MEFGFGSGILTGLRTDTAGTNTPVRFGALQDVSVEFAGDIKELYSYTQFPIDTARGKTKITGKAKVAEIKGSMYNDLFFGQTLASGQIKYAFNESTTLGTGAASYTVANAGSTPLTDQGVFLVSNGQQLSAVSSGPSTASEYLFVASTGVYSFSTFSAGLGVFVNYTYSVSSGFNIVGGAVLMGVTPRFKATLFQPSPDRSQQTVLVLNACVATRLSFPTRIDDYTIQDLDFNGFADSSGNSFTWYTST